MSSIAIGYYNQNKPPFPLQQPYVEGKASKAPTPFSGSSWGKKYKEAERFQSHSEVAAESSKSKRSADWQTHREGDVPAAPAGKLPRACLFWFKFYFYGTQEQYAFYGGRRPAPLAQE